MIGFKELLKFIDSEDKRLAKEFGKSLVSKKERVLARAVKLTEEVGELCSEVLAFGGDQRQEKLDRFNKSNLAGEFADVIITALLLAKAMDIDIKKALLKKISLIKKRNKGLE